MNTYCPHCGEILPRGNDCKFCPNCGKDLRLSRDERNKQFSALVSASSDSLKCRACDSFADFKSKKTEERALYFHDGKGKGKRVRTLSLPTEVVMKHHPYTSSIMPVRGKSLPLKINKDANNSQLLITAIVKRKAYDQSFNDKLDWRIVYPDGQTAHSLPGQPDIPFKLSAYKDDLGKLYSRITLFLFSEQIN